LPRQAGLGGEAFADLAAEIQRVIAGEIAVEHHIAQAALPARGNGRQAGERRLPPAIGFDDTHAARPLGDEETPFRQKRYGPGVLQVPGHHLRSHVLGHGHATRGQHRYRKNSNRDSSVLGHHLIPFSDVVPARRHLAPLLHVGLGAVFAYSFCLMRCGLSTPKRCAFLPNK